MVKNREGGADDGSSIATRGPISPRYWHKLLPFEPAPASDCPESKAGSPEWTIEERESSMSNLQTGQQLVKTRTTAGVGADPEARPASRRDASDHGLHPDQKYHEQPSWSFLVIL